MRGDIMNLKDFYSSVGGNYDDMLGRMLTEERIKKFVLRFPKDGSYTELISGLDYKDYEQAFRAAHTLKGVCVNLGFGNLYNSASSMTEELRKRTAPSSDTFLTKLKEDYNNILVCISDIDK
jgi:chemotaxis protein histidine kinase CheA